MNQSPQRPSADDDISLEFAMIRRALRPGEAIPNIPSMAEQIHRAGSMSRAEAAAPSPRLRKSRR